MVKSAAARKSARQAQQSVQPTQVQETPTALLERPIPDITRIDMIFGKIDHMPAYGSVPDRFKRSSDPYVKFVSDWFFYGATQEKLDQLLPRLGVDKDKALAAIRAIICSFEPKHEHKEAGCACLLHDWFELAA